MERGRHQLPDGAWVEAGSTEVGTRPRFSTVPLSAPFVSAPVVLAAVTSNNEVDAVTTRLRDVGRYRFRVGLQEQESNRRRHARETVVYIAWEPSSGEINGRRYEVGSTADVVTHNVHTIYYSSPFDLPPVFVGDMQSTNERDTSNLRYLSKERESVDVYVDEEQSRDSETRHITETVGYLVLESSDANTEATAIDYGVNLRSDASGVAPARPGRSAPRGGADAALQTVGADEGAVSFRQGGRLDGGG